jgi:UDP-N-acetylmuramoyl-L-alanyl-D-glutamate--2,6-diaminopimelate ligase
VSPTRLSRLLREAEISPLAEIGPDPEISGASMDSRRVAPGDLFLSIRGFRADGDTFVPEALRRGARAVVSASPRPAGLDATVAWVRVEQPRRAAGLLAREVHGRPDQFLTLVGITGTNGKTTVAHLLQSIADAAGLKAGRIGTVGHAFAGMERISDRTTPEAPDLYRLLAEMRDEAIDLVAMEVSSHALALGRVQGARFATALFLNISRDHLDFHATEEDYFSAKAKLFESLPADRIAILPADLPCGERMSRRTAARVMTFGRSPEATVRLREERCGIDGSSAILDTPSGALPVRTFLPGRFNLDNVAAAAACAIALRLPAESISAGVLALQAVPGRLERIDHGQPFAVLVDYAHTESALRELLSWVHQAGSGKVRLVFGCGGDRDRGKRFGMGRIAAEALCEIYLTSDNPRSEDPQAIIDDVAKGIGSVPGGYDRLRSIIDRAEAINSAIRDAGPGDVVLLAGKGHETTQTIGDRIEPFDDRMVAGGALENLGWTGRRDA